jgi:hypothetical protein
VRRRAVVSSLNFFLWFFMARSVAIFVRPCMREGGLSTMQLLLLATLLLRLMLRGPFILSPDFLLVDSAPDFYVIILLPQVVINGARHQRKFIVAE